MNNNIVTIYQFDLINSASAAEFMQLNAKLDQFLSNCPGFQYRCVAKGQDGKWLDMVYWHNSDALEQAMAIEDLPAFQTLMSLIDKESLSINKATLYSSVLAEIMEA